MSPYRRFAHAVFIMLALVALSAAAEPRHVTTIEGISEYRLDNGLSVLLMPDSSRPTTTVAITYFVGSKHEGYGETGMAHLLEHMLFYGTPDHQDIRREISERGGSANGTTSFERTNYFQTLPAGDDNLEWALRMEADRMVNSLIREEDLASEMTVVRNEFEIGESNPFRVLLQRVMATGYEWHGYGRSPIGARSDIENVPIERLHAFYRRFYQPDNAMLVVSGNFDDDDALAMIERYFGAIPAPERDTDNRLWPTYTREPVQDGPREVTVRRSGSVPYVLAGFHVPAGSHEDFAAVEALAYILGDSPSGRLYADLAETGLAGEVGAFAWRLREPSMLLVYASADEETSPDTLREALLESIAALAVSPPTEEEVARASSALVSRLERTLNDSNRVGIGLTEWAAAGDWRLMFLHRDRLEALDAPQVQAVAERYLRRDNRTLGMFVPDSAPQRAEIPDAPDLDALLADYTGRDDRAVGEDFDATPENIESRAVRFELDNGAQVTLLPKSTRGNRVRGTVQMRIGDEASLRGLGAVPGATSAMLMRGSENLSRQELRDRLDTLRSTLSVGGSRVVNVQFETRRDELDALLELMEEVLRRPVFPASELDALRREELSRLRSQRDDPGAVASRALERHFDARDPDHPDYVADFDEAAERLRAVDRDALEAFHRRFHGFDAGTTIALVGDFDADELRNALNTRFGDFRPETGFERIADPYRDVEAERLDSQLDDKANAVLIARQPLELRDDHPDWPALEMAGHMLGGGFLSSRLSDRIRNEEGLSYSVGARFSAHPIDDSATFTAFAAFAPENRDRLIEVMMEELERAIADGFTAEELESARTGLLRQLGLVRADDGRLAGQLAARQFFGRDLHHDAAFEAEIAALTVDDVNAALARWLDPSRLTLSIAGDFAGRDE